MDELRLELQRLLACIDDPSAPRELRQFAVDAAGIILMRVDDERSVTDALAVVGRAVDRLDRVALELVFHLPRVEGTDWSSLRTAVVRLGERALQQGAMRALCVLASAVLCLPTEPPPEAWVLAIVEAQLSDDPDLVVVGVLQRWLERSSGGSEAVALALKEHPQLLARLAECDEVPF